MDGSYPGHLHAWEAWNFAAVSDRGPLSAARSGAGQPAPQEFADRWYAQETLNPFASTGREDARPAPYTLDWFLRIEDQRHQRYARWIPRLLEFAKHPGETLLGLGHGLGTDWVQYARHGASVVVCCPEADALSLARRNFELRGLSGRFLHAAAASLPLESASIDVVCMSPRLHEADAAAVVDEVHRVLKPGGKVLALLPAHYDIDHWLHVCFPWQPWFRGGRHPAAPAGLRFTARALRRLFARFGEHRIHRRHLRRREVPHLWRWLPLPLLERCFGHFLVLKAFKPVSAAHPTAAAA